MRVKSLLKAEPEAEVPRVTGVLGQSVAQLLEIADAQEAQGAQGVAVAEVPAPILVYRLVPLAVQALIGMQHTVLAGEGAGDQSPLEVSMLGVMEGSMEQVEVEQVRILSVVA